MGIAQGIDGYSATDRLRQPPRRNGKGRRCDVVFVTNYRAGRRCTSAPFPRLSGMRKTAQNAHIASSEHKHDRVLNRPYVHRER